MIRSLRAFFLARALREKLLLVAFVVIGMLWWLSAYGSRTGAFWREQRATTSRLKEQTQWIKNKTKVEENAQRAAAKLDRTKTLNANQLVTRIEQRAKDVGLRNYGLSGQTTTTRRDQFAIHTATFRINAAEWEALVKFYEALQQDAPYIAVDQFNLTAATNNPAQLSLGIRATSVEIMQ